jgi:hypothetical protein
MVGLPKGIISRAAEVGKPFKGYEWNVRIKAIQIYIWKQMVFSIKET